MVEHSRHHKVPSQVKLVEQPDTGMGRHTEGILDGMQKIKAIAGLVESVIVWRAEYVAWNVDLRKAEQLLFRLIFKEGSQSPQAMDLLARIYFQQQKYEKAKDLWERASALQPGNPALRRTLAKCQVMAKSPSRTLFAYRAQLVFKCAVAACFVLAFCYGVKLGYNAMNKWLEGPIAVQNLAGRFHYDYESATKDFVFPSSEPEHVAAIPESDGAYNMGFTRQKIGTGQTIGRVEVFVERKGSSIKATGKLPNLYVRYLVEQALWEVEGVTDVDLRDLTVDRSYRVAKGESLWIIARKVYGDGRAWTTLASVNDLSNPSRLRIGQELALPLGDEKLTPSNR